MNGRIDSGLGQIIIDTDVIATYAGKASWKEQPETWHQRQNYRGQ